MNAAFNNFATHNDLPGRLRDTLLPLLNQQLADTFALYLQVKQAHRHVKGMPFIQLHLLFDELASNLIRYVNLIAERTTALGGAVLDMVRLAMANAHLPEAPVELVEGKQVLAVLVQRFAHYAATSRAAIATANELGDQATADLFVEGSRAVDKQLWLLEAHLQI